MAWSALPTHLEQVSLPRVSRATLCIGAVSLEEQARFEVLIPRFLGALRKLGSEGLFPQASDALDTLHDFYLDAWPGVLTRHDPSVGPFDRYAVASFMRFARVRAVRDATLRKRLRPDFEAEELADGASGPQVDESRVAHAVERLPEDRRRLLGAFYGDGASERELSRQHGVSRYVIRVRLAEALAALAAELAEPALVSSVEARLARALFIDGESIELAASDLGLPLSKARALRRTLLARFAQFAKG